MLIFPAIDIFGGKVVRLFKGDYDQMTIYGDSPLEVAKQFEAAGAQCIHMVDLEGAKSGTTPNLAAICEVAANTSLFTEVGGGVRNMDVVDAYLQGGVDRVIIGTAAVKNPAFVEEAVAAYGERIAVGVDLKDGFVATHGWTQVSELPAVGFCRQMEELGVTTVICTDISKDGVLAGCNLELYRQLQAACDMDIIASGGVTSMEDIRELTAMDLYGAIIGKAYYEGRIDLAEAITAARGENDDAWADEDPSVTLNDSDADQLTAVLDTISAQGKGL